MSDKMRWRYGDTNPVTAAVDYATVIEIGDLVYQDVDDAKPASLIAIEPRPELTEREHEILRREQFAAKFLGVAMQRSRAGDTDPIRVATTGVFEYDCVCQAFELGQNVGPAVNGRLLNQEVTTVHKSQYAIGRIAKRATSSATSVLVQICSTIMNGGIQGTTA